MSKYLAVASYTLSHPRRSARFDLMFRDLLRGFVICAFLSAVSQRLRLSPLYALDRGRSAKSYGGFPVGL